MRRTQLILTALLALAPVVSAQSAPSGSLRFDVVSIKLAPDARGGNWGIGLENGRWVVNGAIPVSAILNVAFGVRGQQIQSVPNWAPGTRVAIDARAEGDYNQDQFREMVKNMLVDRFHLAYHMETRPIDVYALTVAKGGAKLNPATATCVKAEPGTPVPDGQVRCGMSAKLPALDHILDQVGPDGTVQTKTVVTGYSVTMADLAQLIPNFLTGRQPVVDQTGLDGRYDMTLTLNRTLHIAGRGAAPSTPGAPEPVVTFASVMKSAWGLELKQKKLPMPVVVVDRLEMPTPN